MKKLLLLMGILFSMTMSAQRVAKVGMNYASCSPFRVPIARLAAAQAAVEE